MHRVLCVLSMVLLWPIVAWGQFQTPHDAIPAFCASPTRTSAAAGAWSSSATWGGGSVPAAGDRVRILHNVTYDAPAGAAAAVCVEAGAVLTWSRTVSTSLAVGTLFVQPGGVLDIGTPTSPIPAATLVDIAFQCSAFDGSDPGQYGCGLLALDGTVTIHGTPRTSFVRFATEPLVGMTALTLAQSVTGWQAGDELLVPDSRNGASGSQREFPLVSAVSGTALTLATPLAFTHPGARNRQNVLEYLPHVANLTRNVVLRSANPTGIRGHTWYSMRSTVDIRYARFQELGRTTTAAIGSGNIAGRYPVHLHHVYGPQTPPANGYQFTLIGNVVHGGAATHDKKWSITLHDSHYGLVQENVVYNAAGWGIGTEDGNETQNLIERNFVSRTRGTGATLGYGSEGVAFWFRGVRNRLRDNVANDAQKFGLSLWQYFMPNNGMVKIPNCQGCDTVTTGQYTLTNLYSLPILECVGMEIYGMVSALTDWWIGTYGQNPQATAPSVITDIVTWHISQQVWVKYQSHLLHVVNWKHRGSRTYADRTWYWFQGGDYLTSEVTLSNLDIQGVDVGIRPSSDSRGVFRVEHSLIEAGTTGVLFETLWTSAAWVDTAPGVPLLQPRHMEVHNTQIIQMGTAAGFKRYRTVYNGGNSRAQAQVDTLTVTAHQGVTGDNFGVFYTEQAPTFVMPQTLTDASGKRLRWACPDANLTNAQCWAAHAAAVGGAVAPCSTTRPDVQGYACPIAPPPQPVVITSQPQPATVTLDCKPTAFSVAVTGDAPITYQWQKDGVTIAGATQNPYQPCVKQHDHGAVYRAVITGPHNTVTSDPAALTVQ